MNDESWADKIRKILRNYDSEYSTLAGFERIVAKIDDLMHDVYAEGYDAGRESIL